MANCVTYIQKQLECDSVNDKMNIGIKTKLKQNKKNTLQCQPSQHLIKNAVKLATSVDHGGRVMTRALVEL